MSYQRKPLPWTMQANAISSEWRWLWNRMIFIQPFLKQDTWEPITQTTGTIRGGLGWQNTELGYSPNCVGTTNQMIDLGNVYSFDYMADWTIVAVVKTDLSVLGSIIAKHTATSDTRVFILAINTDGSIAVYPLGVGFQYSTAGIIEANKWYVVSFAHRTNVAPHIVRVLPLNSSVVLYDGTFGSGGVPDGGYGAPVTIGSTDRESWPYKGAIPLVYTVRGVLTVPELQKIAKDPFGLLRKGKTRILGELDPETFTTDQLHYRWRNDDADEDEATWAGAEDTRVRIPKGGRRRVRVLVNSSGQAAVKNYQLEYRRKGETTFNKVPVE